MKKKSKFIF